MARPIITESQVRRIISEEITLRQLNEGIWDDVKSGAAKLKSLVTKQFGQAAVKWGQAIQAKLSKMASMPDAVKTGIEALKAGMKESGEHIELDDTLKMAKELGSFTKEKALALAEEDIEGPIHDLAAQAQGQSVKAEATYYGSIYRVLVETELPEREALNEFGPGAILGVSLAILGGLPMLFAGFKKLAHALHAHKLAELFEKAEHVTHHFEVSTINAVIPDKLAYGAYKVLHNRGLRFSSEKKEIEAYDEFKADSNKTHAMKQVKGLLYKTLLIYFAFNGLAGVLHAGASLVGFVEGAATSVKGIELAHGAMEIAALAGRSA